MAAWGIHLLYQKNKHLRVHRYFLLLYGRPVRRNFWKHSFLTYMCNMLSIYSRDTKCNPDSSANYKWKTRYTSVMFSWVIFNKTGKWFHSHLHKVWRWKVTRKVRQVEFISPHLWRLLCWLLLKQFHFRQTAKEVMAVWSLGILCGVALLAVKVDSGNKLL